MSSDVMGLLRSIPWFAWIPIVAILGGIAMGIVKMVIEHREKMETIRRKPPD